jgi:chromate transporter
VDEPPYDELAGRAVRLSTVAVEWSRIGVTGFGGPPAHVTLLRRLCVDRRRWLSDADFEDGLAATNLLPGPASTQLAIYCAWRVRGAIGAIIGGLGFILPGLVAMVGLSLILLGDDPNPLVLGAAAGAGAAVPAVAVHAGTDLIPASWRRTGTDRSSRVRWLAYLAVSFAATATLGAWVVVVLLACGIVEDAVRAGARRSDDNPGRSVPTMPMAAAGVGLTGLAAVAWVAVKVGALSYGGGFVIVPLMQYDAVHRYQWMTDAQFLYAVALGQITPGPVVHTVAGVGYAAAGISGALLAAGVAFTPSFLFVLAGARRFDRLRGNARVQAFLAGAGPAAIGAIFGSAVLLTFAISHLWQIPVLVAAVVWLVLLRRGVVLALLGASAAGLIAALAGLPVG